MSKQNRERQIPEGFNLMPADNSFNDAFAPLYLAIREDSLQVGMWVEKHHLNPMGICHGAVYMALLDIAFAGTIGCNLGKFTGTPTITINLNYMAASKEGEWLYTQSSCQKTTRTMGFAEGMVRSDTEVKVSGSGVFKLPADLDSAPGVSLAEIKAYSAG